MRFTANPVHLLSFLLTFLATRSSAFLLPGATGAIMTGDPPAPPPAAALAPPAPGQTTGVAAASSVEGGAPAGPEGGGSTSPSHLVVLAHGLSGTADDLSYLKRSLERAGGADVLVHSARCNQGKTKDGVAEGGTRLANEILELVGSTPSLSRISLVGNSLGGLYARYAAKLLYSNADAGGPDDGATIAGLKPSVFMTIATPHLGVRRFTYVPLPSILHPLAGVFVGKTGADLFLSRDTAATADAPGSTRSGRGSEAVAASSSPPSESESPSTAAGGSSTGDNNGAGGGTTETVGDGRESSLVYRMGTSEEFLRPLKAFRWRRVYANRRGDFMVPYETAAFVEPNEGDGSEAAVAGCGEGSDGGTRGAIVASATPAPAVGTGSFSIADRFLGAKNGAIVGFSRVGPAAPAETVAVASGESDTDSAPQNAAAGGNDGRRRRSRRSMEEEMAAGLNSCGWEKVSVDFGSLAPFSHNKICALSRTRVTTALYGSGKSVVDHAADFLVARDIRGIGDGANGYDDSGLP